MFQSDYLNTMKNYDFYFPLFRLKLEKLKAEADQLQDLFDFSPLANTNDLLTRVLLEFKKVVLSSEEDEQVREAAINMPPDTKELLRYHHTL